MADMSSVHGLRYLGRGSCWSRMAWLLALLACTACAASSLYWLKTAYAEGLDEVRLLAKNVHVSDVPFPAVYLCPDRPFKASVVEAAVVRWLKLRTPLSSVERESVHAFVECLSDLMFPSWRRLGVHTSEVVAGLGEKAKLLNTLDLKSLMLEAFPACNEVIKFCSWHKRPLDCCSLMELQFIFDGWCFVFNSNYTGSRLACGGDRSADYCPVWRSSVAGKGTALMVSLSAPQGLAQQFRKGVWVKPHSPFLPPSPGGSVLIRPSAHDDVRFALSVMLNEVADDFESIHVAKRQCRLDHEVNYHAAKGQLYSRSACMHSFMYIYASDNCGCVPITLKFSFIGGINMPTCPFDKWGCLANLLRGTQGEVFESNLTKWCPHGCTEIVYEQAVQVHPSELKLMGSMCPNCYFLDVSFDKSDDGKLYQRRRSVTSASIFVQISGFLGLLLGCGVLAGVEAVYFICRLLQVLVWK